jgi:heme O synthase-like polyprenyltransferase
MEIQQILIFALVGAIAMIVMAGGAAAMMDSDAEPTTLAMSSVVGAGMGAGAAWALNGSVQGVIDTVMQSGGGSSFGIQEMRVGLPAF